VLFDRFEYKQIVDVVTPLLKDPSRAKGREFEGAAVLVQLGIAQQQLATGTARSRRSPRRSADARRPEIDAYLIQANLTARRFDRAEALAREALRAIPISRGWCACARRRCSSRARLPEANKLLEDAVARQPKSRDSWSVLPTFTPIKSAPDDALRVLGQARQAFGDDQTLGMRFANVYEGGGRLDDAEKRAAQAAGEGSAERGCDEFPQLHARRTQLEARRRRRSRPACAQGRAGQSRVSSIRLDGRSSSRARSRKRLNRWARPPPF
jgi:tetratricopeptide (TPR) repeat protein